MYKTLILLFALSLCSQTFLFSQAGLLDISFGINGIKKTDITGNNDYGFSTVVQPDGKIIVVGIAMVDTIMYNNFVVVRYLSNGDYDSSFGTNGIVTTDLFLGTDDHALSVCLQADGKIIVAGKTVSPSNNLDFALVRYNTDGSLDLTFDNDGIVTTDIGGENDYGSCVKLQTDGKILVAGYSGTATNNALAVIRYHTNGSLDNTFDTDGIVLTQVGYLYLDGQSMAIQNDGKILASASTANNSMLNGLDFLVVRYHQNGSLDTSFDHDGILITDGCYQDHSNTIALQNDGKIIVGGSGYDTVNISMGLNFLLLRYNSNGSLDSSFNGNGKVFTEVTNQADRVFSVAVQGNGKIIAVGHGADGAGDFRIALTRYLSDGSLDNNFGSSGIVTTNLASLHEFGESVAIQQDGKIVITGFFNNGASFNIFVARYIGDTPYPLSIQQSSNNTNITISPNPFSNQVYFESKKPLHAATINLYSMEGKKVKSFKDLNGTSFILNRDYVESGLYFFDLIEDGKILAKEKILIVEKN